jgi:hypothetical protein
MASRDLDPDVARRMGREEMAPHLGVRRSTPDPFPIKGPPRRRWRVALVAMVVVLLPPVLTLVYYSGRTAESAEVRLTVAAVPEDATVQLDGVEIGGPSPKVLYVRPGPHLVTVKHDGFERFDRALDLQRGNDVNLPVVLARSTAVPDAGPPAATASAATQAPRRPPGATPHARPKRKAAAPPAPTRPGVLYLDLKTGNVR